MKATQLLYIYPNPAIPFFFLYADDNACEVVVVCHPETKFPPNIGSVIETVSIDVNSNWDVAMARVVDLHATHCFDAIVPCDETSVVFVAHAAARLGLRGSSIDASVLARDKLRMRAAFHAAELNTPVFRGCSSDGTVNIEGMKFPLVVKPTSGYSSIGVKRVDTPSEMYEAISKVIAINEKSLQFDSNAGTFNYAGIIVEEYIEGLEFAADCFVVDGRTSILGIAEKAELVGPLFADRSYIVPGRLTEHKKNICAMEISKAILALGIRHGPTHVEFRFHDGKCYIIELAARIGGGGTIDFLTKASSGLSLIKLMIDDLRGCLNAAELESMHDEGKAAASYVISASENGTIASIAGIEEVARDTRVRHVCRILFPGDKISGLPDAGGYIGFVLSHHDSTQEAFEFHNYLDRTIQISYT